MRGRVILVAGLGLTLVVSSVASAWVHHERRRLFDELTGLERDRDQMVEQWGRLEIERGTLGDHEIVLGKARDQLGLQSPDVARVVVVTP